MSCTFLVCYRCDFVPVTCSHDTSLLHAPPPPPSVYCMWFHMYKNILQKMKHPLCKACAWVCPPIIHVPYTWLGNIGANQIAGNYYYSILSWITLIFNQKQHTWQAYTSNKNIASVNSSSTHPPPPSGISGTFFHIIHPGGRALAYHGEISL